MDKIIMEQLPEGRIAVNEESLENILYLASAVAMEIIIPEKVDKEKDPRALFLRDAYGCCGALVLLAFFHPEIFAHAIESMDVAEIKFGTAQGSEDDILNKLKKMKEEMYS